jgi:hypothetical protein
MKLGRTYDKEDYEEAIIVVGHSYEEKHREIEHTKSTMMPKVRKLRQREIVR